MKNTSKSCLASDSAWYCIRGLLPISPNTTTHILFLLDISLRHATKAANNNKTTIQSILLNKYGTSFDNFKLLIE